MRNERRFEQHLIEGLADLAAAPYPDYVEDVLAVTARTRRRPAWVFPSRWLPMNALVLRPLVVGAARLRPVGVLTVIGLLLLAAAVAWVGSRPKLPSPFGAADNGLVAYTANGDIHVVSPDGTSRVLVTGPGDDVGTTWSLDGTRLAFVRLHDKGEHLIVANADGSGPTELLEGPLNDLTGFAWSPDSRELAVGHTVGSRPSITIVRVDGTGSRTLDLPFPAEHPQWRPPDGAEILVRAIVDGRAQLRAVAVDGSGDRAVTPAGARLLGGEYDMLGAGWSPDGSQIAYHTIDPVPRTPTGPAEQFRVHVVNADGTGDRVLTTGDPDVQEAWPAWSPDGTRVAIERWRWEGDAWLAVVSVQDGRSVDLDVATPFEPNMGWTVTWAPDGSRIVAFWDEETGAMSVDPATGAAEPIDWPLTDRPDWQRVAP